MVVIYVTVTVIQSCDIKKDIEDSRTDNIIQYGNNMFVRIAKSELDFISFYFIFSIFFSFLFDLFSIFKLRVRV